MNSNTELDEKEGFKFSPTFFLLIIALVIFALILMGDGSAYNYDHVNVTTRVNVTNAGPTIINVTLSPSSNGVLIAGAARNIECNASIRDYNGFNDVVGVNATFYYYLNLSTQQDDRNEHYTNASCVEVANDGVYIANYSCTFPVYYFANNGTWHCNVTARDNSNYVSSGNRSTTLSALYALNVTNTIDYGNLSVLDYSENKTALITNFGNMNINVSVQGFGQTPGDGLGFVCSLGTNISVENQRFYKALVDWPEKIALAATNKDLNLTLAQQTDEVVAVTANTYWQLYVPPNPFGVCTGKVRFTATTP